MVSYCLHTESKLCLPIVFRCLSGCYMFTYCFQMFVRLLNVYLLFSDVCPAVCWRESGPSCAHLQAAQGENTGINLFKYQLSYLSITNQSANKPTSQNTHRSTVLINPSINLFVYNPSISISNFYSINQSIKFSTHQ